MRAGRAAETAPSSAASTDAFAPSPSAVAGTGPIADAIATRAPAVAVADGSPAAVPDHQDAHALREFVKEWLTGTDLTRKLDLPDPQQGMVLDAAVQLMQMMGYQQVSAAAGGSTATTSASPTNAATSIHDGDAQRAIPGALAHGGDHQTA